MWATITQAIGSGGTALALIAIGIVLAKVFQHDRDIHALQEQVATLIAQVQKLEVSIAKLQISIANLNDLVRQTLQSPQSSGTEKPPLDR